MQGTGSGQALLAPSPAWEEVQDTWSRGCLSLRSLPRGPSVSEPRNHVSITELPGLTPMHTEDRFTTGKEASEPPLTPTSPNGTCQGLDPGPLKEPGRAVVIIQLIIWGIPAGIDPAVRWLVGHIFKLRG